MIEEARLEDNGAGLAPVTDGWFAVNVRDTAWINTDELGSGCLFEGRPDARFAEYGVNIQVLEPGQPNCMYHRESAQEDFLVLAGECILIVEGQERRLTAWDFVHCPANTEHVFVGVGDGPCSILMIGARPKNVDILYPASDVAARHGASVETETAEPADAYAKYDRPRPERPENWDALPWASV